MIVKPYKGFTDRYVARCKDHRKNSDNYVQGLLVLLGVGILIAICTAL